MPKNTRNLIFFFLLGILSSAGSIFAQGRRSTPFVYNYEISSPNVTCFAEDPNGFMWIGTNHGLNRYNGTYYDVHYTYQYETGLKNDNIFNLMVDEAGDVWLLSEAGLSVQRDGRFYHYGNQSGFVPVFHIADLDKEHIIIANNRGVDKIRKSDLTLAYHFKFVKPGMPKPIGAAGNGYVLVSREKATSDEVVVLDEQMREVGTFQFAEPSAVKKIMRDFDGTNWIVTGSDVYHVDIQQHFNTNDSFSEQKSVMLQPAFRRHYGQAKVLFAEIYDEKNLILGVQNEGLYLEEKNTGQKQRIYESETLPLDKCICYVDSHHNLWLSDGKSGFSFLPATMNYEHLNFPEAKDQNFKKLCFDKQNRLWLRSSSDLICYDPETHQHASFSEPGTFYADIFIDSQGKLWTIENYTHLKCYEIAPDPTNRVGAKLLIARHYNIGESPFSMCEDTEGRIWATLTERFVVIEKDGTMSYEDGPFKVSFTSLQSHGDNRRLFLYTIGHGIYEYNRDGRFEPIVSQIQNSRIIFADSRNILWIGTSNRGLVCYDVKSAKTDYLQDRTEVDAADVKAIEEDSWGNIWFSTSTMIFRYNTQNGNILSVHDDHLRGGIVYNLYASARDNYGRVYFGNVDGVTVVDPVKIKYQKKEIPVKVEDIIIGGNMLYQYDGEPFVLDYDDNNLVIWFSGLDFSMGRQLSYEYRLEGYDNDWHPAPHQPRIAFANLPAGDFTLRIRIKPQEGSTSMGETAMSFSVRPAPWLTIWAKIFYVLVLVLVIYFSIRQLVRRNVRRERLRQFIADRIEFEQKRLNEQRQNSLPVSEPDEPAATILNEKDMAFLNRFHSILDAHLADEVFGIAEMSQEMGIGEAKLYQKVKTLTSQTPKAYFVTYRMNKAMELLKSGQYNVSEVGYMVGATSPAVFSRAFKHQFGISPSAVE